MVRMILFRVTTDLFKSAESHELTTVLLKENLPPSLIFSVIREFLLMEKDLLDKSSLSEDSNLLSKFLKSVEVLLQEN